MYCEDLDSFRQLVHEEDPIGGGRCQPCGLDGAVSGDAASPHHIWDA